MRVLELTSWNERPSLMSEWQRLWSEQQNPPVFVHPTWARIWWRHFGAGRRLRLMLVEEAGQAIALAPLYLERPFPAPGRLRIVGSGITSDYTDWLLPVDPEVRAAVVDVLFDHLARRWGWLTLELQGLRADTALFPHVDQAHRPAFLVERRVGPRTLAIDLEGTWDAYLRSRHHGLRKKLRSRPRQLGELGEVTFEHADPSNALAAVDDMIHLHDVRWAGRNDATLVSSSSNGRAFYRAVLPQLVEDGIADLVTMRLDGRAIASQVGFQIGGVYYNYQAAFDPAMAHYAPGLLILAHLVERAWDAGLERFDFMTGDEPYKHLWANQDPFVTHVTIFPNQPVARVLVQAMGIGRRIRSRREAAHPDDPAVAAAG
jgi:CelD/BcsL family acetyltransferase involved in cellulose biosynthesis